MPRIQPPEELTAISAAVARFEAPASLEEIAVQFPETPRRTLQRRLATLVASGRLKAQSHTKGRRYQSAVEADSPVETAVQIPLSPAAEQVRKVVIRTLSARRPVGYRPEFLESYRPNETFYLPPDVRSRLLEMGRTSNEPLPAGVHLRKVLDRLQTDLSWNSSRLDGNTYSMAETQRLLEAGESAPGHPAQETQMLLNHKAALELLAEQPQDIGFNRYTVCSLHALVSDNLLPDEAAGGRLRDHALTLDWSAFRPLEAPQRIEEHFDLFLAKAGQIEDAFEQAFFALVHLPYLKPFDDMNKRVSRLAANIPLVQKNFSPLSFCDLPQSDYLNAILGVYELNRVDYLRDVFAWTYERSCARYAALRQSSGEPDLFRLRHREALIEVVSEAVRGLMNPKTAAAYIAKAAHEKMPPTERTKFQHMAESDLFYLHAGSFARYRLLPAEFAAWKSIWC